MRFHAQIRPSLPLVTDVILNQGGSASLASFRSPGRPRADFPTFVWSELQASGFLPPAFSVVILFTQSRNGSAQSECQTYLRSSTVDRCRPFDSWLPSLCGRCGDLPSRCSEDPESQLVFGERGVLWRACRTYVISESDCLFGSGHASAVAVGGFSVASGVDLFVAGGRLAAGGGLV